jgi:hypothetical protein
MYPYIYDHAPDPPEEDRPAESPEIQDIGNISSLSELVRTLCDFLDGVGENDLKIRTPEELIYAPSVKSILKGHRVVYDPQKGILVVRGMAPLHDSIQRLASRFLNRAQRGFLTPDECDRLQMTTEGYLLTRKLEDSVASDSQLRKKPGAWLKFPDARFDFEDPDTFSTAPTIVFEASFSKKYDDLLGDAHDWLSYTRGKVRLVVRLQIQEDVPTRKAYQESKKSRERVEGLLKKYGNARGREIRDMAEDDVTEKGSDTDLYDSVEEQIVCEDWVGPITAYLEFWEAGPFGPRQRGERVVSRLLIPLVRYIQAVVLPQCPS